ncbi:MULTISPECIES: hypothetical protein [Streptomyces griseus group]|uniref:Uncharacterized protein n=1 Tax=Streptomyces anulatus TaxID=1892 RepID=A0A6G3SRH5_STRAQ|nr:hypothetical protein [Streptomyces anulatus]NEB85627.1 hypothetical protein [Streptomyces anulatus]NEC02962.1 hypothetical protein [Streptomyces anulatus]NED23834.1 hypothetical protein [Streptomyces anulatus]
MSEPMRYSTPPVELPLWMDRDPVPAEGCAGCAELAAVRSRARAVGDMTTVSDCNVYLRRHPEGHQ